LRGALSGWWLRRIDQGHRLVYRAKDDALHIAQCRVNH
jgi:toxin YoeB